MRLMISLSDWRLCVSSEQTFFPLNIYTNLIFFHNKFRTKISNISSLLRANESSNQSQGLSNHHSARALMFYLDQQITHYWLNGIKSSKQRFDSNNVNIEWIKEGREIKLNLECQMRARAEIGGTAEFRTGSDRGLGLGSFIWDNLKFRWIWFIW